MKKQTAQGRDENGRRASAGLDLLSNGRVDFATGRGYDRKEYAPFGADFFASAEIFEEGIDVLLKAWNSPGKWSHKGKFYDIPEMSITPKPVQKPIPFYVASFSRTSLEMAAKRGLNIIYAPFAAGMVFGGLDQAVNSYREACVKAGQKPGRAMCSYFIYIADDAKQEDYGRERQMDYFNHCVLQAFPQKKEDLSDKSILLGSPQKIIETLKKVEASGVAEVILYFNVGNKPHSMVKEQMHRFMKEIAPHFQGKHIERMKAAA